MTFVLPTVDNLVARTRKIRTQSVFSSRSNPLARRLSCPRHYSENFMIRGTVLVEIEMCKGCELCVMACPQECLGLSEALNKKGYQYARLTSDGCTGCENCALVCPDAVLTVYREPKKSRQPNLKPAIQPAA